MQKYGNLVDLEKIMLKNAPTLAIGGVDTAENEPLKVWGYGVCDIDSPPHSWVNRRNKYRSETAAGCTARYERERIAGWIDTNRREISITIFARFRWFVQFLTIVDSGMQNFRNTCEM